MSALSIENLITFISEWFDDEQRYRCLNLIPKKSIEGLIAGTLIGTIGAFL